MQVWNETDELPWTPLYQLPDRWQPPTHCWYQLPDRWQPPTHCWYQLPDRWQPPTHCWYHTGAGYLLYHRGGGRRWGIGGGGGVDICGVGPRSAKQGALSVCLSDCLPACLPACLYVCLSICLSENKFTRTGNSLCLSSLSVWEKKHTKNKQTTTKNNSCANGETPVCLS